jgi:signal transduction histidine kinase
VNRLSVTPLSWRVPAWLALTAATVWSASGTTARVASGIEMGVAVVAMFFVRHRLLALRRAAIVVATVGGLLACFAAPKGLGEVIVVVAAARLPDSFDGRMLQALTALDTAALAGTVGYISRSVVGVLAGAAIPLFVERSLEHRELLRERDRARALLAEVQAGRDAEAQAAALRERSRIARDMHDVLAHSLAGLSVQLQAARAVAGRDGAGTDVVDALDKAGALARSGLAEARAAVGALRDPVGLGLAELPALVQRHPGAATLEVHGTPGAVAATAGHAVYRAVQESLTNAARYAPGSPVRVDLRWSESALRVLVTDSGPARDREPVVGQGTGLGLAGMDERLRAVGGSLQAGPRTAGGWQIAVQVPANVAEEARP